MTDKKETKLPDTLQGFTDDMLQDLKDLRAGKITLSDARVRTQMAREILRSIHLQLEGLKFYSDTAKQVNGNADKQIAEK